MSDVAKCPVMGPRKQSNRDWWPNQLDLSLLHQHSSLSDPTDKSSCKRTEPGRGSQVGTEISPGLVLPTQTMTTTTHVFVKPIAPKRKESGMNALGIVKTKVSLI